MIKKTNSLDSFMWIVDSQHPEIKPYIISAKGSFVEIHLPFDEGKTWSQNASELDPIFNTNTLFPIKKCSVSFVEKYDFFRVMIELN